MSRISSINNTLEALIDETQLYWIMPPFEGKLKLRYECPLCKNEGILLDKNPVKWKDLIKNEAQCFICKKGIKAIIKFVEFEKTRETIFDLPNITLESLTDCLNKLILIPKNLRRVQTLVEFERRCRPTNFRTLACRKDWIPPLEHLLTFESRRESFYGITSILRTRDTLIITAPTRDPSALLPWAFKTFAELTVPQIRGKWQVTFQGERSIDMGGPIREFFIVLSKAIFSAEAVLFTPCGPNQTCHISPVAKTVHQERTLLFYRAAGRFVAKALLEGYLIECNLTTALLKLLCGHSINFNDLESVDRVIFRHLSNVLELDPNLIDDLGLTYTANIDDFGATRTYDLISPAIDITKDNFKDYANRYAAWRMLDAIEELVETFLFGFYEIIPSQCLGILLETDISILLQGVSQINIDQWLQHTEIEGSSQKKRADIRAWFGDLLRESTQEELSTLLHFATGSSKIISFANLEHPFKLRICNMNLNSLPTAHTCFNLIDIPPYDSKEVMITKFRQALSFGAMGFGIDEHCLIM